MAAFLRRGAGMMRRAALPLSGGFSSFSKSREKVKTYAKKTWDSLDKEARGAVYSTAGKSVLVLLSGGTGWLTLMGPLSNRQDRFEEQQTKVNEATEATISEMKVQIARKAESVSQCKEEIIQLQHKCQKLENELKDMEYAKELWLFTAYKSSEGSKTA